MAEQCFTCRHMEYPPVGFAAIAGENTFCECEQWPKQLEPDLTFKSCLLNFEPGVRRDD